MDELHSESYANWRTLQAVWAEVQTEWQDQQALTFAERFWNDFAGGMNAYLRLLDELVETLDEAAQVAWDLQ
ncbi:MAG: hypothetical protein U0350_26650 [Caldilineaceae bacterium]